MGAVWLEEWVPPMPPAQPCMKCEDDYYLDHETELCVKHEEPEEPIDDEGNCKEDLFYIEEKNLCVTKKVCEERLGMMAEEIWVELSIVEE